MRRQVFLILVGILSVLISVALYSTYDIDVTLSPRSLDDHDVKYKTVHLTEPRLDPMDWRPPTVPSHLQNAHQDDEELIQHIRDHWIIPPYPVSEELTADDKRHHSQSGQTEAVDKLLGYQRGGFFIECGAGDGRHLSNTLFLEKMREWTGLLVEVEPSFFRRILHKKRHSYMINACLSPVQHPVMLNYTKSKFMGGLDSYMTDTHKKVMNDSITGRIEVQCFPLVSILKAIRVQHIDYFSLDVEGPEVDILKTVPFDEFQFRTLTIEYRVALSLKASKEKLDEIRSIMCGQYGYREVEIISKIDILLEKHWE